MASANLLNIWIDGVHVATLAVESELFELRYTAAWLDSPRAYPLSPALPLRPQADSSREQISGVIRRFFENLLPEGKALDEAAQVNRLSKANIFGLLRALGRESAGAMMLLPPDMSLDDALVQSNMREIPYSEMSERIRQAPYQPFSIWDGKVRLSIAGYQEKLAVRLDENDRLWLADGALASTHILKPEIDNAIPFQTVNEHFGMRLAAKVGIPTAPVRLLRVPEPVLIIERFDRKKAGRHVSRIHIIDGCQALDMPVAYKYEHSMGHGADVQNIRDGVSLPRLFSLRQFAVVPAAMSLAQLRWAIVQTLIGNSDAHGKNMSFFVAPGGLAVAPAYDQISVDPYPSLIQDLAMAVGDNFDGNKLLAYDWANFAYECGLNFHLVSREAKRIATKMLGEIEPLLHDPVYQPEESLFLTGLADCISRRAEHMLKIAGEISGWAKRFSE